MANQLISQQVENFIARKGLLGRTIAQADNIIDKRHIIITTFIFFLIVFYSLVALTPQENTSGSVRVALVQGNVLVDNGMTYDEQVAHFNVYEHLTMDAARLKPNLIVWPATSLPDAPKLSRLVRYMLRKISRSAGTYLLVGGAGYEKVAPIKEGQNPFSNSEYLIRPTGGTAGQYNKMHLLAFNEYVPLQGIIKWPPWITTLQDSFVPGEKYTIFQIAGKKFGTPICSENLFSDHFRRFVKKGAQFMVSVSNEGFLERTIAPYQTLAMNVFRAVENRVSVARDTTTGISAFISPSGEILDIIHDKNNNEIAVAGIIVRDIPLSDKKTFYTRFGDIFAFITIGLSVSFIALSIIRKEHGF